MHPILFEIPGLNFKVRAFGVMVALGFLLGSWILGRLAARYGHDPKGDPQRYASITSWIVIGVILGARLMYVVVETLQGSQVGQGFLEDPLSIFYVWQGGLVMYGGMLGAIGFGMFRAWQLGVAPVHALDLGLVAGFVGQAIGRVGCLLVGDDHGKVVPEGWSWLPFPITLRVPDPLPEESLFGLQNAGLQLWATQPLMSLKALLVAFIGWQMLKHRKYAGQVSLVVLLSYSVLRFGVEMLRGDSVRGLWFGNSISTSQLVSLVVGTFALVMLWRCRDRRDPLPDARLNT
ncbi:MAG: prolipoprotein diacylglyceryl transferase [Planctomycetota bacterium]|jgi:phosphatidylglycerol:prolipoprotein diacylglycerol transferase